ncbi:hypothetical protein SAMN06265370_106148 [Puniceibacterium sediminis]|uniref:Uncharacterized protein n=1 Tax=Puniceibacterium sediminis TaxID=1608407 RepID=A0A238WMD0_9RHOB|nr:hypothetical protein SAMN06265370_106148 [Puniceibacterium sediminis]
MASPAEEISSNQALLCKGALLRKTRRALCPTSRTANLSNQFYPTRAATNKKGPPEGDPNSSHWMA